MKVFIIGGTGLLGAASATELIRRGHEVKSLALPPLPDNAYFPKEMEFVFGDYMTMSNIELEEQMKGCDAFVFAAGVDERIDFPAPVLSYYTKYNITPVDRFLKIGKELGIKRAIILGSYFSYFAKQWSRLDLTNHHPYIKSRILQEEVAMSYNGEGMDVMILELPYIFGVQPGRKPVWTFMVEMIQNMKGATFFPKGGTTMVTVKQVAEAVAGALEKGKGGTCYPVGWFNMTWREMLAIFHKYTGMSGKMIITVPTTIVRQKCKGFMKDYEAKGIDHGLNLIQFVEVQTRKTYIDKAIIRDELGVTEDDIDRAIGASVKQCLDVINGKGNFVEMKGEC